MPTIPHTVFQRLYLNPEPWTLLAFTIIGYILHSQQVKGTLVTFVVVARMSSFMTSTKKICMYVRVKYVICHKSYSLVTNSGCGAQVDLEKIKRDIYDLKNVYVCRPWRNIKWYDTLKLYSYRTVCYCRQLYVWYNWMNESTMKHTHTHHFPWYVCMYVSKGESSRPLSVL